MIELDYLSRNRIGRAERRDAQSSNIQPAFSSVTPPILPHLQKTSHRFLGRFFEDCSVFSAKNRSHLNSAGSSPGEVAGCYVAFPHIRKFVIGHCWRLWLNDPRDGAVAKQT
jgi:hypothetical protein